MNCIVQAKGHEMKAGETQKFSCDVCAKDFEITLEADCPYASDATPELCPFCGTDIIELNAAYKRGER